MRIGLWCLLGMVLAGAPAWALRVGEKLPAFACPTADGGQASSSDLPGKVTAICFTASWVKRAGEELQYLQSLSREFKDKNLVVLPVLERDDRGRALAFAGQYKLTLRMLLDDGKVAKVFGVNGRPDLFLVDAGGVVRGRIVGFGPASPETIRKQLLPLLNAPAPKVERKATPAPAPAASPKVSDIPPSLEAYAHLQLGAAHISIGDAFINAGHRDGGHYAEAVKELKSGLSVDPKNVDLTLWLGVAYEREGEQAEAVRQYQAALALDAGNSYAREGIRRLRGLPPPPPPPPPLESPSND